MFKHNGFLFTDSFGNIVPTRSSTTKTTSPEQEEGTPFFTKNAASSIPPQFFSGMQLINIYNIPTIVPLTNTTKKVTIAIVVAFTYPNLKADLKYYWQNPINFGPTSTPPTINVYTMPGAIRNAGWAQEECLDVQMVCTINPNANIWVIEAKSATYVDLLAAVTYATTTVKADVVSMSWGGGETKGLLNFNSKFTNPDVCYCAAAGDSNAVSWPATSPNCIAVGGTTLLWNPNLTPPRTEYACNFSGCGYSNIYTQPAYQSGAITNFYRSIPDISLIADSNTSVYSVYNNNWYGVGGTSVSTPIFAGIVSLANQQRINAGKRVLTSVIPAFVAPGKPVPVPNHLQTFLYKTIYPNTPLYTSIFYDVTSGTNRGSTSGKPSILSTYSATSKFDIPTGLGSPNVLNLCNALVDL
jgi:subtilase family serine protease